MRILQANKFFYRRGGAEVVFLNTIKGLRTRGHEVIEFSMKRKENLPSDFSAYFIPTLPELTGTSLDGITALATFGHLFHSNEVIKKIRALSLATDPQVAHLHNVTHQLSASIFTTLKKLKIPIVLTVHDVQPMCPSHRMIVDHSVCERCFQHKYFNCVRYRCIDKSCTKSAAGALEMYYYWLRGIWKMVDKFICPSEFMLNKMVEWGFPKNKMVLVRNPAAVPEKYPSLGDCIVYLGRLHEEKGIKIFMQALPHLRQYPVIIAGNGPESVWVDNFIKQYSLTNVHRTGWVNNERWQQILHAARVMVVPSLFYENCSLTILDALSLGKIVVATDRGGNPELIKDGVTGFLAKPENVESLQQAIKKAMMLSPEEAKKIGENGRKYVKENHSEEEYYQKLEEVYQEVVKN